MRPSILGFFYRGYDYIVYAKFVTIGCFSVSTRPVSDIVASSATSVSDPSHSWQYMRGSIRDPRTMSAPFVGWSVPVLTASSST